MMSARWQLLCGILVLGLWLAAASSKECPYRRTGYVPKPLYPGAANIQSDCYNTNPDHGYKSPSKKYSGVPQRSYCPKVGGLESHCQPAKDCAVWYDLVRKTPGTACTLNNGYEKGLCCPGLPSNSKLNLCSFKEVNPCEGVQLDDHVRRWDLDSVNAAAHHAG